MVSECSFQVCQVSSNFVLAVRALFLRRNLLQKAGNEIMKLAIFFSTRIIHGTNFEWLALFVNLEGIFKILSVIRQRAVDAFILISISAYSNVAIVTKCSQSMQLVAYKPAPTSAI